MGNTRKPISWVPLDPIIVTSLSSLAEIPFDGAGFRTVKLALVSQGAFTSWGNASEHDIGRSAIAIPSGAKEPTVVTLSVEALPYYLYSSIPNQVLVQPFGMVGGEQRLLSI